MHTSDNVGVFQCIFASIHQLSVCSYFRFLRYPRDRSTLPKSGTGSETEFPRRRPSSPTESVIRWLGFKVEIPIGSDCEGPDMVSLISAISDSSHRSLASSESYRTSPDDLPIDSRLTRYGLPTKVVPSANGIRVIRGPVNE